MYVDHVLLNRKTKIDRKIDKGDGSNSFQSLKITEIFCKYWVGKKGIG